MELRLLAYMFSALRRSGINVLRRYQTSGEKRGGQDKEDQTKILFSTPEGEEGEGRGKDGMDLGKKNNKNKTIGTFKFLDV